MPNSSVSPFARAATMAAILLILFNPLGIDLYLSAMPAMQRHFQADVAISLSVFIFSLGLGQLLFGPLADRIGRKPVALGGLLLYAAAAFLASRSDSLGGFLGLRALQGLGASASSVCAFTLVRDCFSGNAAAQRYSLLNAALNVVPAMAPLLGGWLTARWGWQSCFLALAGSAVLAAAWLAWKMPETRPVVASADGGPAISMRQVLSTQALRRYGACCCAALALIVSYVTLAPAVLIERGGVDATTFGLLFGGNALLVMAASFLGLKLIGRFGQKAMLRYGLNIMLLAGVLLLALSGQPGAWHYMLPIGVLSVGFAWTLGPASGMAMAPFSQAAGRAAALLGCGQMLFAAGVSAGLAALPLPGEWALGAMVLLLAGLCRWLTRPAAAIRENPH
ncbi:MULTISPECIES: Bcr/CflA family efflux MFS transporter [Chromobacterium]|uniref:Bcr/CflA family efflux MFS transporter n=1 Tax=Chromobacterium TaxID=535 RepID=UPI0002E2C8FD|nr:MULTISPECIES: Bcr/CflA family efflux MFS transporter [Chromobacterium]